MTQKGSGTVLYVRSGEGSGCEGGPRGTFHRSDETGRGQRASDSVSFQEWQYWLDRGLPKDARSSVSDKAEEIEEPEAAEVVTGDLVRKL